MRTPPSTPVNKYVMHSRVEEVEVVAANALTLAKEALAQLKLQPPRGEKGETGPAGLSIKGDAGRDGKDGKDGVGYAGRDGMNGTNGKDGKDGGPGPDSAEVLAATRAELANVLKQVADLSVTVAALLSRDKRSQEYVEFLAAKVRSKS